ncbi:MAG: GNAT family N-acetyltransferase [Pseudomonadota bacterium]
MALQQAAYARNRALLGVEPLPLRWDYAFVLAHSEVWVRDAERDASPTSNVFDAALIMTPEDDGLLIDSLAVHPNAQGRRIGTALLDAAVERARALGRSQLTLYTGAPLVHLIAWYERHGFNAVSTELLDDRTIVHMCRDV